MRHESLGHSEMYFRVAISGHNIWGSRNGTVWQTRMRNGLLHANSLSRALHDLKVSHLVERNWDSEMSWSTKWVRSATTTTLCVICDCNKFRVNFGKVLWRLVVPKMTMCCYFYRQVSMPPQCSNATVVAHWCLSQNLTNFGSCDDWVYCFDSWRCILTILMLSSHFSHP